MKMRATFDLDSIAWKEKLLTPHSEKRAYDGVNILTGKETTVTSVKNYIASLLNDTDASGKYALTLSYTAFQAAKESIIANNRINERLLAVFVQINFVDDIADGDFEFMQKVTGLAVLAGDGWGLIQDGNLINHAIPEVSFIRHSFSHDTGVCNRSWFNQSSPPLCLDLPSHASSRKWLSHFFETPKTVPKFFLDHPLQAQAIRQAEPSFEVF